MAALKLSGVIPQRNYPNDKKLIAPDPSHLQQTLQSYRWEDAKSHHSTLRYNLYQPPGKMPNNAGRTIS